MLPVYKGVLRLVNCSQYSQKDVLGEQASPGKICWVVLDFSKTQQFLGLQFFVT